MSEAFYAAFPTAAQQLAAIAGIGIGATFVIGIPALVAQCIWILCGGFDQPPKPTDTDSMGAR